MNTQERAIHQYSQNIVKVLQASAPIFIEYLRECGVITTDEAQMVNHQYKTNKGKILALLEIVQHKDNGWSVLNTYLVNNDHGNLASKLQDIGGEISSANQSDPLTDSSNYNRSPSPSPQQLADHRPLPYTTITLILSLLMAIVAYSVSRSHLLHNTTLTEPSTFPTVDCE